MTSVSRLAPRLSFFPSVALFLLPVTDPGWRLGLGIFLALRFQVNKKNSLKMLYFKTCTDALTH